MPVKKGRDFKGRFYRWGSQKKYYYSSETARVRAKRRAALQGRAIRSWSEMRGRGVWQNIKNFISGRKAGSPELDKYIRDHGDEVITQVNVGRVPIAPAIHKALSVLTLGKINSIPFDRLFHLFMVIRTGSGSTSVEKNQYIQVGKDQGSRGGEWKVAWTRSSMAQTTTVRQFFDRTLSSVGSERFYVYSAFKNNCQRFVSDCLLANHILTPELHSWILQDPEKIVEHLPGYTSRVANAITDTAARVGTLLGHGAGGRGGFRMDVPRTVMS